ncbi:hypothetical protein V8C35DRAFT_211430 [Trichoderma chlorosporum]
MSPFENQTKQPQSPRDLRVWNEHVQPEMQGRHLLWGDYWNRFNTMQIPILNKYNYFDKALAVAKLANGQKDEFERIFEEENRKRREEVLKLMSQAGLEAIYGKDAFPCDDARNTVSTVCGNGCLEGFLRLLKGTVFGWEADVINDGSSDDLSSDPGIDTQYDIDYDIDSLIDRQIREEQASCMVYLGTYQCGPTTDISPEEEKEDMQAQIVSKKRKRVHFDDSSERHSHESESTTPSSVSNTPSHQAINKSTPNDDAIPNNNVYAHKRQRIESHTTLNSTSITPPLPVAAEETTTKKRPRCNDDDDDDDDNHETGHKRQKHLTHGVQASTTISTSDASTQQTTGRQAKRRLRNHDSNGSNNRKKKKSTPPSKRLHTGRDANTRSTRRNGQSILWELDHLGKPRSCEAIV